MRGKATCLANFTLAQEAKKPVTVKLDEVVVTATKTPIKVDEVPASVDVVTSEDLQGKAKSTDVFNAVRDVPGVQIKGTGSALASPEIFIRGSVPGILIDGRDNRHFSDYYSFNPNLIDIGVVERIEVLKGPQSTMHGAKSVSGAVNFIMKKGDKDNPFISLRNGFGSDNTALGGITTGGYRRSFLYI